MTILENGVDWGTQVTGSGGVITYSFDPGGGSFEGNASFFWSAYEIQQMKLALDIYETFLDITFQELVAGGDFFFVNSDAASLGSTLGYFHPPGETNAGWGFFNYEGTGWDWTEPGTGGLEQGGYGFVTIIHELGHGLGLAHPHDTGGTSSIFPGVSSPFDDFGDHDLNQGVYTTMSYNDGWQTHPDGTPASGASYGFQGTPMAIDIAVLQDKYGANLTHNTGNDIYVLPSTNGVGTFFSCIWDADGDDTIMAADGLPAFIDLRAATLEAEPGGGGFISYQTDIYGGFTIANGVVIENAIGGSAADVLRGNSANNTLVGNNGDDSLYGDSGDDELDGGAGADDMEGGDGNDTYMVDNAGDTVTENAGEGIDEVQSSISFTLGVNVENLTLLGGAAAINGTGNGLANTLIGNSGNNTLDGKAGADDMKGGVGNDTYIVDNAGDAVTENAGEGTDEVKSSISFTLVANVENLTLTGASEIEGAGNGLANTLIGNSGNNTLDGKAGADDMRGGGGNDTYIVDDAGDAVTENAGEGTDEVTSSISFTLAANVENLTLTGSSEIDGTGNGLANILIGSSGNNTLDGKAGADDMEGGDGNDTYIVDNAGDTITENAGEGTDEVRSSVSFILVANVENLTLTGSSEIDGAGNGLANTLIGNSGNNTLDGKAGADDMKGGAGNDTYIVDDAGDSVTENAGEGTDEVRSTISFTLGANVENLTLTGSSEINGTGNGLANAMTGNSGNNTLDGKAGADDMKGGDGNDIYIVDNTGDTVTENAGEGTDTVQSSVSFTLGANVETLMLVEPGTTSAAADIDGTGNGLANTLIGNSGNNTLDGKAGADLMQGGLGNDTYIVDNAADIVAENAGEGTDTVRSGISFTLGANVENLVLTGSSEIKGTGNGLDNTIIGNAARNVLKGQGGDDIFAFVEKLGKTNVDRVKDFTANRDTFGLDQDIFKKVGSKLNKKEFVVGSGAKDKNDRIIYDKNKLIYDKNGSKKGGATAFAKVDKHLDLDHKDFMVDDFVV